jgi:hypothetical protein
MTPKKLGALLLIAISSPFSLLAQQAAPTSGDVVVRLAQPVDFATARPIQMVRATVVSSTNPAVSAGGPAILQVVTRDGSYTLKLVRLINGSQPLTTMSQAGVSTDGTPASGKQTSLPVGATLSFTLTQQDGTPGRPVQQAAVAAPKAMSAAAAAQPVGSASGNSADRSHFEIEGVMLGQTLAELLDVAKPFTPKQAAQNGSKTVSFKTKDLEFMVFFSAKGILNRMSIVSKTKATGTALSTLQTAMASSPTFKKAQQAYGKPDQISGDNPIWNGAGGSTATYQLEEDEIEILTPTP